MERVPGENPKTRGNPGRHWTPQFSPFLLICRCLELSKRKLAHLF
jgi:hypothetical protein